MDSKQLRVGYRNFFEQSDAGVHFIKSLDKLIDSKHREAEKNPDNSRDYTQRACGIREVINMIKVMTVDTKVNRLPKGEEGES